LKKKFQNINGIPLREFMMLAKTKKTKRVNQKNLDESFQKSGQESSVYTVMI